jgi:hypothetical protein
MKNLQSIEEGTWKEIVLVELTEAEKFLLDSNEEMDIEAKAALHAKIKANREKPASKDDAKLAKDFYANIKPELKEEDDYLFLAMNIMIDKDEKHGILNCQVNGSHKQIRF